MTDLRFLTGLRGVAALYVCIYHIQVYVQPYIYPEFAQFLHEGYLAVDFFFILSGFVIALNYFNKINLTDKREIAIFYAKRIARIYPLHLLLLLLSLSVPLAYFITERTLAEGGRYSIDAFFMSIFMIQNWGFTNTLVWNIPSWSISTEFFAYLMFPFIVAIIKWVSDKFHFKGVLILTISLFFSIAFVYSSFKADDLGLYIPELGLLRCIIGFFIGVLIWFFYHEYKNWISARSKLLFYLGLVILVLGSYSSLLNYWYIHLAFSLIIIGSVYYKNGITRFCSTKTILWLGEISYSIYLIHYLVKDWFKILFLEGQEASILWIFTYLVVVLFLSHFSYKWIEIKSKNVLVRVINNRLLDK